MISITNFNLSKNKISKEDFKVSVSESSTLLAEFLNFAVIQID